MADMKDSGERQQFKTGAMRQPTKGNGSFDLLPLLSMIKQAKIFQNGSFKYKRRNWENGIPLSRYFDSALRHMMKFALNFKDEEHLSQAVWNISCLEETKLRIDAGMLPKELDDLPSEFFKKVQGDKLFAYLFDDMNESKVGHMEATSVTIDGKDIVSIIKNGFISPDIDHDGAVADNQCPDCFGNMFYVETYPDGYIHKHVIKCWKCNTRKFGTDDIKKMYKYILDNCLTMVGDKDGK